MNLVPNKQLLLNVPFQSTKNSKKILRVDNREQETMGDVYCPACRNEKCVYISTNKMSGFYDGNKCTACCHVFNIPFTDQKPTILLFTSDGTHCFVTKTSRDCEKEKPCPLLKKFLRQSQSPAPKKRLKRVQISNKRICFLLADHLSHIFNFQIIFIQFQSTVNQ